jgi:integrase
VGDRLRIYDLRRSFAVWMEDAGIPRSRRKHYLGHSAGDVTGLYERRELLAWFEEDAARLQTYAGIELDALCEGLRLVEVA